MEVILREICKGMEEVGKSKTCSEDGQWKLYFRERLLVESMTKVSRKTYREVKKR